MHIAQFPYDGAVRASTVRHLSFSPPFAFDKMFDISSVESHIVDDCFDSISMLFTISKSVFNKLNQFQSSPATKQNDRRDNAKLVRQFFVFAGTKYLHGDLTFLARFSIRTNGKSM